MMVLIIAHLVKSITAMKILLCARDSVDSSIPMYVFLFSHSFLGFCFFVVHFLFLRKDFFYFKISHIFMKHEFVFILDVIRTEHLAANIERILQ